MNAQGQQPPAELLMGMVVCFGIFFLVILIIQILFLVTLFKTLKAVDERNREMQPGMVFLTLIPLFGTIWAIILVGKLGNSLEKEFDDRRWNTSNEGFGRTPGMIWAWGGAANVLISIVQYSLQFGGQPALASVVSILSLPIALAIFICWIMFWVQMAQYGRRIREGGRGYAAGGLEEDYDDELRPRRDEEDFNRYEGDGPKRNRDD